MSQYKPPTLQKVSTKELIKKIVRKSGFEEKTVSDISNYIFEEIIEELEQCHSVNIKDFGTFFVRATLPTRIFKFNPCQKLRYILGWSSIYKNRRKE